jgi:hypothetical protein
VPSVACPICQIQGADALNDVPLNLMDVTCVRCGTFKITAESLSELQNATREQRIICSGWLRENQKATIVHSIVVGLLKLPMPTLEEKVDKILLHLSHKFPKHGETIELFRDISLELQGVGYCDDQKELRFIFRDYLHDELGFLLLSELPTLLSIDEFYKISPSGWAYIDSLKYELANGGRRKTANAYVDSQRLDELRKIRSDKFDLTKLIQLCEELNRCLDSESYNSMIMLTRAIIDHVPPIFGYTSFSQVANNYSGGKSFRASMQNLENSCRNIADQHLHNQIRKSETVPTFTQVNFHNDLDVLLAEVVRVLK